MVPEGFRSIAARGQPMSAEGVFPNQISTHSRRRTSEAPGPPHGPPGAADRVILHPFQPALQAVDGPATADRIRHPLAFGGECFRFHSS